MDDHQLAFVKNAIHDLQSARSTTISELTNSSDWFIRASIVGDIDAAIENLKKAL